MISLPSSRRLVTPALLLFVMVASIRLFVQIRDWMVLGLPQHIILDTFTKPSSSIAFEVSGQLQTSIQDHFLEHHRSTTNDIPTNPRIARILSTCNDAPNPYTNHVRLSKLRILNISMIPTATDATDEFRNNQYFNPAILPLPSYVTSSASTSYHYLLVSRLVTSGTHQESHICFADICAPPDTASSFRSCTDDDINILGLHGGMRCVTRPEKVNIPSTPSRKCSGSWSVFPDVPGFHDPRVFWSGRGEPLIEVNSGSTYGCVGLWLQDLRSVFPPLDAILKSKGHTTRDQGDEKDEKPLRATDIDALGATTGYSRLTELTRNPKSTRAEVEKNWVMFFPSADEMWVQYNAMGRASAKRNDSSPPSQTHSHPGRTISQILSHGLTTTNLTSRLEPPCFNIQSPTHTIDPLNNSGHWHQGTNSLRLILCTRSDFCARRCTLDTHPPDIDVSTLSHLQYEELLRQQGAIIHFSIIHRKFTNEMDLPMRYERYVLVWEARPPFRVVAVSRYPFVFGMERVRPWRVEEDVVVDKAKEGRGEVADGDEGGEEGEWEAYFTYTPSIAWAYRGKSEDNDESIHVERGHEELGTGYLDDEVIVGVGMDDVAQGFVKVHVEQLLSCLRGCPEA